MSKNVNPIVFLTKKTWQYSEGNRKNVVLFMVMSLLANISNLFEPLIIAVVLNTMQLEGITRVCRVANETAEVTTQLLGLLKDYPTRGKQVHDANIVATMLAYDIDTLLTLNVDDFKRFEDKITLVSLESEI